MDYTCISSAHWKDCGAENTRCKCNGMVRFGAEAYWTRAKRSTDYIDCTVANFGDPFPYKAKKCQCADKYKDEAQDCEDPKWSSCQEFGLVAVSASLLSRNWLYSTQVHRYGFIANGFIANHSFVFKKFDLRIFYRGVQGLFRIQSDPFWNRSISKYL